MELKLTWGEIFLLNAVLISHCDPQYFKQFDHNDSDKLEIDECVKNE